MMKDGFFVDMFLGCTLAVGRQGILTGKINSSFGKGNEGVIRYGSY